jgi:hypothetical protein
MKNLREKTQTRRHSVNPLDFVKPLPKLTDDLDAIALRR